MFFPFSYVPALRPLRQQAFLLNFPQTQPSRLAQRLSEVQSYNHTQEYTNICQHTNNPGLHFVCRSHSDRGWRQTQALWCHCVRRLTTTSGLASTHYRWVAALWRKVCLLHEQFSSMQYNHITICVLVCTSSSTVAATSRWTQRPSSVSLWGRRTRTKACSICGRRSSSYSVQNGTGCPARDLAWNWKCFSVFAGCWDLFLK